MSQPLPQGVAINAPISAEFETILTTDALALVAKLHRQFESRRRALMAQRATRQAELDAGHLPDFLPETAAIRSADWKIAPLPKDLLDRRAEITGPVERKMMINALNSGAKSFMPVHGAVSARQSGLSQSQTIRPVYRSVFYIDRLLPRVAL